MTSSDFKRPSTESSWAGTVCSNFSCAYIAVYAQTCGGNARSVVAGSSWVCASAVQHMCKYGQESGQGSRFDVCNCIGDVNIWICEAHLAPEGIACAARESRLISLLPEQDFVCEAHTLVHITKSPSVLYTKDDKMSMRLQPKNSMQCVAVWS